MTHASDDRRLPAPTVRRIRGDAVPAPHPMPWRRQRAIVEAQIKEALPPPPASAAPVLKLGRLEIDLDALFAFGITVPMVFLSTLGTKGAAVIAALFPLYLFVRRRDLVRTFASRAFVFIFPGYALASVLWSAAKGESLKFAVELLITVTAGVLIASAANKRAVIRAVALAFAVYVADAVATGGTVAVGVGSGGAAFSGLTESKNLMADIAGTGLLIALAAISIEVTARRWIWVAVLGFGALIEAYALVAARSAGALMAVSLACAAFGGLNLLTHMGRAARAWITAFMTFVVLIAGLNFRTLAQALVNFGAEVFDKDPTLTGRTYLWYRAEDVMQQVPLLGRGYGAFWLQGNTDAEGLWAYAGILDRGGFNFHNTVVDLRVTLGWLGVAIFFGVVGTGMLFLIRRFVTRPTLPVICWTSVALYEVSRMAIESIAFQQFYHPTLLLFTAISVGVGLQEGAFAPGKRALRHRFTPADYSAGAAGWNPLAQR